MTDTTVTRAHWSFWVIGVVALVWNALGVVNFFIQTNAGAVTAMPEAERAIIQARPAWATAAFAIAVFSGALGGLLLLVRKSAALYLFVASLLGVMVQTIPYFGLIPPVGYGRFVIAMYMLMPLAITAFFVWYAKRAKSKGVIK